MHTSCKLWTMSSPLLSCILSGLLLVILSLFLQIPYVMPLYLKVWIPQRSPVSLLERVIGFSDNFPFSGPSFHSLCYSFWPHFAQECMTLTKRKRSLLHDRIGSRIGRANDVHVLWFLSLFLSFPFCPFFVSQCNMILQQPLHYLHFSCINIDNIQ